MINKPRRHGDTEFDDLNELTKTIIGAAIEVHRVLGPGLLESIYESAMCIELDDRGLKYKRQMRVPASYKGRLLGEYKIDFIVEDLVVVEIKTVAVVLPIFEAQLITYIRLAKKHVGLILNFKAPLMKDGIVRRVV
jgi:GxxExxY protein